jgi:hypothetical protein
MTMADLFHIEIRPDAVDRNTAAPSRRFDLRFMRATC